jgi:putative ABC transport system substrate-binding protein
MLPLWARGNGMQFGQLQRRTFIKLIGSAAAWPLAARAQQGERVRRIGVVSGLAENNPEGRAHVAAFQEGLQKLGWREGRNVRIDVRRGTTEAATMQRLASELVAQQPDPIVTQNSPATAP